MTNTEKKLEDLCMEVETGLCVSTSNPDIVVSKDTTGYGFRHSLAGNMIWAEGGYTTLDDMLNNNPDLASLALQPVWSITILT